MKKLKVSSILLLSAMLVLTCGGKEEPPPGGPSGVLLSIRDAGSFDDLMKCYSSDTRAVIEKLIRDRVLSKESARTVMAILDKDSAWEIVTESKKEEKAETAIRITRHRIENRIGAQMHLMFIYEDGSWVVDMEEDLRAIGEMHKKSDTEGYLRKQFRRYQ